METMAEDLHVGLGKVIGNNMPVFVVAEIGQNHQGSVDHAKRLIQVARDCGADGVKFQKTCLEERFNKEALKLPYKSKNAFGKTYGEHRRRLEFSDEDFLALKNFANELGILFFASAMDSASLNFLISNSATLIKIGSGDANNLPMIREAASKNVPLIISTGMQDFETVKKVYATVSEYHKRFAILHCVSAYPAPVEEINLRVLELYKKEFPDVHVGYSGHELGIHVTLGAVALGAKIIERHLTLNRQQKGSDHVCSLEPKEFKALMTSIRSLELALGAPIKRRQPSEAVCYKKLGKTIVASRTINKGAVITAEDLKIKVAEPQGIDGSLMDTLIGKTAKMDIQQDETILEACVE